MKSWGCLRRLHCRQDLSFPALLPPSLQLPPCQGEVKPPPFQTALRKHIPGCVCQPCMHTSGMNRQSFMPHSPWGVHLLADVLSPWDISLREGLLKNKQTLSYQKEKNQYLFKCNYSHGNKCLLKRKQGELLLSVIPSLPGCSLDCPDPGEISPRAGCAKGLGAAAPPGIPAVPTSRHKSAPLPGLTSLGPPLWSICPLPNLFLPLWSTSLGKSDKTFPNPSTIRQEKEQKKKSLKTSELKDKKKHTHVLELLSEIFGRKKKSFFYELFPIKILLRIMTPIRALALWHLFCSGSLIHSERWQPI